jgi:glycosyltransferase involved in cell wall biosynthesis
MKKDKNVVILADGFINWGGGVDFITSKILAFLEVNQESTATSYIIFPPKPFLNSFSRFLMKMKIFTPLISWFHIKKNPFLNSLNTHNKNTKVIFSFFGKKRLSKTLKKLNTEIALFSWSDVEIEITNIGYYPDLQHKYLVDFFSQEEKEKRDSAIKNILKERKGLIVNAESVKKDFDLFFPQHTCHIFSLPFAPICLEESWLTPYDIDVKSKYSINFQYFLISNQFWIHKSHKTAFEALKILTDQKGMQDIHIICTGKTEDSRFPHFIEDLTKTIENLKLKDKIHILGHIPKREQIEIMKESLGVLQPTLFEGGPGGGAVHDAISLGVPSIVSDIPVNKEIKAENVYFFKTKDAEDLSKKMHNLIVNSPSKPSKEKLLLLRKENLLKTGRSLEEIINYS